MSTFYGGSSGGFYGGGGGGFYSGSGGATVLPASAARKLLAARIAQAQLGQQQQHHGGGLLGAVGFPLHLLERATSQIADSLVHTPAGLYRLGKGITEDVAGAATGDLNFDRTRNMAKAIGLGVVQDFEHPLRNPGYLAMDLFNIGSLGAGTVEKLGQVGRFLREDSAARAIPPEEPLLPPGGSMPPAPRGPSGSMPPGTSSTAWRPKEVPEPIYNPPVKTAQDRFQEAEQYHAAREETARQQRLARETQNTPAPMAPAPGGAGASPQELLRPLRTGDTESLNAPKVGPEAVPIPSVTLNPAERQFEMEGTKLTVKEAKQPISPLEFGRNEPGVVPTATERVIPGQYQVWNGAKKVGPVIAGAKEAVAHMVRHYQETAAGIPSHLTHPELAAEAESQIKQLALEKPKQPAAPVGENAPAETPPAARDTIQSPGNTLAPGEGRVSVQREAGTNPRARGIGTREMGVNKLALRAAGLTAEQATEVHGRIASDMRDIYKAAQDKGHDAPPPLQIKNVLNKHLPPNVANELFNRIIAPKGGAPGRTAGETMRIIWKGLTTKPARTATLNYVRDLETKQAMPLDKYVAQQTASLGLEGKQIADVHAYLQHRARLGADKVEFNQLKVLQSRNPLVRYVQAVQLGLMQNLSGTPLERVAGGGRTLTSLTRFEKAERTRISSEADLGQAQAEAKAAGVKLPEEPVTPVTGLKGHLGAAADTANQLAQIGILYLKPSYYGANLIGQMALVGVDHAWNPVSLLKNVSMQRELYKDRSLAGIIAGRIKGAMQEGIGMSVQPRGGLRTPGFDITHGVALVHHSLGRLSNKLLDTPFRDNAFINEARRQGYTSVEEIKDLVMNPAKQEDFLDVARRANKNIIDYGRLTPTERQLIRRVIFFYPWIKAATIYAPHFFAEHPGQALALTQQGKIESARAQRELGPLPSYLQGVFKVGSRNVPGIGKQPIVFNPLSETILGQAAQTLETTKQVLTGGIESANNPVQYLTPAISAVVAAAMHQDPFTGRTYPGNKTTAGIIWDQLESTPAFMKTVQQSQKAGQIASGQLATNKVLVPYTTGEAVGRFLGPGLADVVRGLTGLQTGPAGGYAINQTEARSRWAAEQKNLASKTQKEVLTNQDYLRRYTEAGKTGKLWKGDAPADLKKAFSLRADQMAARQVWAARYNQKGNSIAPIVELGSDLDLLVRKGQIKPAEAHQIIKSYGQVDDNTIRAFIRKLSEAYFGAKTISIYKKEIGLATGTAPSVP